MSSNSAFESLGGGSTSGNPSVEEAYLFLEHKVDPFGQLDPRDQEHPLVGPEYIQEECESLSEGSSSVRRSRSSEIIHPPAEGMEVDGEESHGEDVGARVCFEEPLVVPKQVICGTTYSTSIPLPHVTGPPRRWSGVLGMVGPLVNTWRNTMENLIPLRTTVFHHGENFYFEGMCSACDDHFVTARFGNLQTRKNPHYSGLLECLGDGGWTLDNTRVTSVPMVMSFHHKSKHPLPDHQHFSFQLVSVVELSPGVTVTYVSNTFSIHPRGTKL